jgi:hypothetical protein
LHRIRIVEFLNLYLIIFSESIIIMKKLSSIHLFTFSIFFLNFVNAQPPGQWVWLKGSYYANPITSWGTMGVTNSANQPPAVYEPCEWKDNDGNFWFFGGVSGAAEYGGLWKYNPLINQWTWIKGTNLLNYYGNYGIQGIPSPSNNPPGRGWGASSWVDKDGNFWMFGGFSTMGKYSDLWKYDVSTNEWAWMKGPNTCNQPGIYGIQGVPDIANNPSSRCEAASTWTDNNGELWLFGGSDGNHYNDLWKYNIITNTWTWMKGANITNQPGVYGTLMIEDTANTPGARGAHCHWKDNGGNLWLFGGAIFSGDSNFNDLWKYNVITNNWTWMGGSNHLNDIGFYGIKCIGSTLNIPSSRFENRACWTDENGNFWMLGGTSSGAGSPRKNDLWLYEPLNGKWTWVSGDSTLNPAGHWGTIGIANPANHPSGRFGNVAWGDNNGHLYFFGGSSSGIGVEVWNDLWRYSIDPTCGADSITINVNELSFLNSNNFYITLFPNPFNDGFSFHIYNSSYEAIQLFVYDVIGREVENYKDVNENTVVGNNLRKGIYIVEARQGNNTYRLRVVKD